MIYNTIRGPRKHPNPVAVHTHKVRIVEKIEEEEKWINTLEEWKDTQPEGWNWKKMHWFTYMNQKFAQLWKYNSKY